MHVTFDVYMSIVHLPVVNSSVQNSNKPLFNNSTIDEKDNPEMKTGSKTTDFDLAMSKANKTEKNYENLNQTLNRNKSNNDISSDNEIDTTINYWIISIDLNRGPTVKLALF